VRNNRNQLVPSLLLICALFSVQLTVSASASTDTATAEAALIDRHLIPLQGGRNFRDMGGIETMDGRSIRTGLLYRAGVLNHLTAEDYRTIESFDIRTIVDFRDAEERLNEPTDWQAGTPEVLAWDYALDFGTDGGLEDMLAMMSDSHGAEMMMASLYRTMVEQQKPHFQSLFQTLLQPTGSVLFHCTAGKDRTGIAAALIQTALGVERETLILDYTLSETILNLPEQQQSMAAMTAHDDSNYAMLAMLPEEAVAALMGTRRVYLEAAFDEMTQRYGSVEAYISDGLGVSEQDLEMLRAHYLD